MAGKGTIIEPTRFNQLKAAIKAECLRRSYTGSVASYGGSTYDYSVTPAAGVIADVEHYEKIMVPLNAITGAEDVSGDKIIDDASLTAASQKISQLSQINRYVSTQAESGCAASCTGLCAGCSGSCTGGCTGGCDGCSGCGGSCSDDCTSGCSGGCDGCTGCGNICSSGCGTCTDACSTGCSGGCAGTSVDTHG